MASYVAAYRIGMLVSTAGALFLVSGFEALGFGKQAPGAPAMLAMAALVLIGMATDVGRDRARANRVAAEAPPHARQKPLPRVAREPRSARSRIS